MIRFLVLSLSAFAVLAALPATAQDQPLALQPSAAAERAAELAAKPTATPAPPRGAAPPFDLMAIDVASSAHLSPDAIAALVQRLTGHRYPSRAAAEQAVIAAFDAAFVARGQMLAASYVDPAAAGPNRIALRFVEARAGQVQITGDGAARNARYYRFIFGLSPAAVIDSAAIAAQVQRMAQTDGTVVQLAYSPGATDGTSDVAITVTQPKRPAGFVTVDNMGEAARGENRLSFGYRVPSLTGFADPLALTGTLSRGGTSATVIYTRPVDRVGGVLTVTATAEDSETLTAPVIGSQSAMIELGYARPLLQDGTHSLGLTLGVMGFADISDFAGVAIKDQRGAAARVGVTYLQRWEKGGLVVAPSLRWTQMDDAVAATDGQSGTQFFGTFSAQLRGLAGLRLDLGGAWQYAFDANTPARFQFAAAGPTAVRGYPAGGSSGDAGYVLRLNLSPERPYDIGRGATLSPFAFFDAGQAFDRDASGGFTGLDPLRGAGVGANLTLENGLTAALTYARALRAGAGMAAGEPSLTATLTMTF